MGRSKEFDEREVLVKAMAVFLEKGYEGTSMNDLVEHMGIHRKSLYDTFGDKHSLFLRALDLFGVYLSSDLSNGLMKANSPRHSIQLIFQMIIEGVWDSKYHWGCLYVNTAVELSLRDEQVRERAEKAFTQMEQLLKQLIISGQQVGEISRDYDAQDLAEHLHNTLIGIRVLIRNATPKEKLYRIAETSFRMLV